MMPPRVLASGPKPCRGNNRGSKELAWHDGEKRKHKKVLLIYRKYIIFKKYVTKILNLTHYLESLSKLKLKDPEHDVMTSSKL